jgi:molybdopterin/thiamine biosynthesis adenylyltransferase
MGARVVAERCVDAKTANACFRAVRPYREVVPSSRTELNALKNLISQADLILSTTDPLPENRHLP